MKSFQLLFCFFLILNITQAQTTYFVKFDATGADNGTSWGDAFNDLQDAIAIATSGDQVWVAAGTYLPGTANTASFFITTDVLIYGGFAGTENSLTQRNIGNNPTILSGDVNDDDVLNDFVTNRADNVSSIMYVDSTVTTSATIDGFIFESGHAGDTASVTWYGNSGGGVWALGAAQFSNCVFRQNFAQIGGGGIQFINDLSEGAKVMNCTFEQNNSGDDGAALAAINVWGNGIDIDSCQFTGNDAAFTGGATFFFNTSGVISNSNFTDNYSGLAAGACFFTNNATASISNSVYNCMFEENESSNAGAVGFQSMSNGCNYIVKNCTFLENAVSEFLAGQLTGGGALFFLNFSGGINAWVDSCHFERNESDNLGGALVFFDSDSALNNKLDLKNTVFESNMARYGGGIQTWAYGTNQEVSLLNCEFLNNEAEFFGGGYRTENEDNNLQITVDDCLFDGNQAIVDAGGFEIAQLNQGVTNLAINNVQFLNNTSGNEGAGLNFYTQDNGSATIHINHSVFGGNSNDGTGNAEEGAGGFSLNNFGLGAVDLHFESNIFNNNTSADGAGAIQLFGKMNDEVYINNCLMFNNIGGDYGGGIGIEGALSLSVLNTTIANNNTGIINSDGTFELQNTILFNPGLTDYMGSGTATAISMGGNLIGDQSLANILLPIDQSGLNPLFIGSGDYQLQASSPAVDAGRNAGVSAQVDLAGNNRIQGNQVDIGAYESPFTVSTEGLLIANHTLTLYPNPAIDVLHMQLENNWVGDILVAIVNLSGQKTYQTQISKTSYEYAGNIMISQLANGPYQLVLSNRQEVIVKRFTKVASQ